MRCVLYDDDCNDDIHNRMFDALFSADFNNNKLTHVLTIQMYSRWHAKDGGNKFLINQLYEGPRYRSL